MDSPIHMIYHCSIVNKMYMGYNRYLLSFIFYAKAQDYAELPEYYAETIKPWTGVETPDRKHGMIRCF